MDITAIEAHHKPCSKCKHVRRDTNFKDNLRQMDFAKCAATNRTYFCTTERGSSGKCGPKGRLWDPVNEEDRIMAKYDPDTHEAVPNGVLYAGAGCVVFTAIVLISWLLGAIFGDSSADDGAARKWRKAYYELSCKSRGLELNTRNKNDFCMDPKNKALYEVD